MRKNTPLALSILLNLLLLALAGSAWLGRPAPSPAPGAVAPIPPAIAPIPQTAPAPFRWSQLEAADYPAYIANLRAIACPEETIRDLITADVASVYDQKRQEARQHRTELGASGLEKALSQLWQEQTSLVVQLLGPRPGGEDGTNLHATAAPAAQTNSPDAAPATGPRVSYPLALADLAPSLQFTEQQLARFDLIRKNFIKAVGGPDQDPTDPGYLRRWQAAKKVSDEQFALHFGGEAFVQQQMQARRATRQQSAP